MNTKNNFNKFGVMLDNSRNAVMKPDAVKKYIDILARLGYNCLMLYTEDTYELKDNPYFGHNRGRYSSEELKAMDIYARSKGIELIPCIQTLAHLNAITRWETYSSIIDCNDILLCDNEKTYALIDSMFCTIAESFSSKTVNIGMDEAHMLGRGKYMDIHGCVDRFEILLNHLNRVSEIAGKYGLKLIMWGDMFFRLLGNGYCNDEAVVPEKVKDMIPDNVNLIYWDYYSLDKSHYSEQIRSHAAVKDNIWFAGGLWTWTGFTPHNGYSIKATEAAFSACAENGIRNAFLTVWGDNGGECSRFSVLPSLYYAAQLAKGISDFSVIKDGFKQEFGISFDDFMLIDMPGTPNAIPDKTINSEKYFLYNDCFMGLFDCIDYNGDKECYAELAQKLKAADITDEYRIIFDSVEKLSELLAEKRTLGIDTRKAYESGNKNELLKLEDRYLRVTELAEEFYEAYERQWMWENKPQGFDVQDIRLGGLIRRIMHCRSRILKYVNGEIERIEELEEPLLNISEENRTYITFNSWDRSVTSNVI